MRRRAWILFAAVSVLWGIPYLLIKVAVDELSPPFVAWARIAIGAAIVVPLAWRSRALSGLRPHRRALIAFGVIEIALPFLLIASGERFVSSSLAAILIAAVPLTVAALAARFAPAERPTGRRMVGLVIGLCGVVALVGVDVAGRPRELLGALCVLTATVGYAAGPLIVRRHLSTLPAITPVACGLVVAAIGLLPGAALGAPGALPSARALGALVVLGVACTALALVLFLELVAEAGPARATVITYVNPVVAVALGVSLLGESVGAPALAGLGLILGGSWISTRRGGVQAPQARATDKPLDRGS